MAPVNKKKQPKDVEHKRKYHDPEIISQAITSVKNTTHTLRQAAKAFRIPLSTLADKISGRRPVKLTSPALLTPEEEKQIAQWFVTLGSQGFGRNYEHLRNAVKKFLVSKSPESENDNTPSRTWVYKFLARHPELTCKTPTSLGKERAVLSPIAVKSWYEEFHSCISAIDPSLLNDPSRIYNAGEAGFGFDCKSGKVITSKKTKHVYKLTSNTKPQITVLFCASAAGHYMPPTLIYPYERIPNKNLLEHFPEALLQVSDNGWISAPIFYTWLKGCFIPQTAHLQKPVLLLVDGHASHTSLNEVSELCVENDIILYCLLAHASHLMQPLDQAFLGALKPAWYEANRQHVLETGGGVGLESFAKVFKSVWNKTTTLINAHQSFKAAGIYPFAPECILSNLTSVKLEPGLSYNPPSSSTDTSVSVTPALPPLPATSAGSSEEPPTPSSPTCSPCDANEPSTSWGLPPLPITLAGSSEKSSTSSSPTHSPCDANEPSTSGALSPLPSTSTGSSVSKEPSFTSPLTNMDQCSDRSVFSSAVLEMSVQQIKAVADFSTFILDELARNKVKHFLAKLKFEPATTSSDEDFKAFGDALHTLVTAFHENTPDRVALQPEDIFKMPDFSSKWEKEDNTNNSKGDQW